MAHAHGCGSTSMPPEPPLALQHRIAGHHRRPDAANASRGGKPARSSRCDRGRSHNVHHVSFAIPSPRRHCLGMPGAALRSLHARSPGLRVVPRTRPAHSQALWPTLRVSALCGIGAVDHVGELSHVGAKRIEKALEGAPANVSPATLDPRKVGGIDFGSGCQLVLCEAGTRTESAQCSPELYIFRGCHIAKVTLRLADQNIVGARGVKSTRAPWRCAQHDQQLGGVSPLWGLMAPTTSRRQLRRREAGWEGSWRTNLRPEVHESHLRRRGPGEPAVDGEALSSRGRDVYAAGAW